MNENMEPKVEKKTNKKKMFTIVGVVAGVIVLVAAAFIGGRFLNQRGVQTNSVLPAGGSGVAITGPLEFSPASELPTTQPELTGTLAERKDNTIYIQTFSMDTGGGGVQVMSSSSASSVETTGAVPSNSGPKVEVVITNDTKIYKDVTEWDFSSSEGTKKIQQVVEPGDLDDLTKQTMITIWGRKVGDRVIADVIVYSNPISITAP
jgi:hypothetical protein